MTPRTSFNELVKEASECTLCPAMCGRSAVLSELNGSPEARQIIVRIARGGNPDLQARAVQHLGAFGGAESKQALLDIFKSSNNLTVKRNPQAFATC